MSKWEVCSRFLGLTMEYISPRGEFENGGNLVILRCEGKIDDMERAKAGLRMKYNPKKKLRNVPLQHLAYSRRED